MGFFSSALSTESSFGARPLGGLPANRDFEVYREPTAMSEWNEAIEADAAVGALPPGGLPLAWHFDVKNISFEGRQGTQGSEAWSEACSDGVHMQQPSQCVRVPAAQFEVTSHRFCMDHPRDNWMMMSRFPGRIGLPSILLTP